MKKDKLEKFLNKGKENEKIVDDQEIISKKDGLYERVDKKLVTKDGKQLLREQLYEAK